MTFGTANPCCLRIDTNKKSKNSGDYCWSFASGTTAGEESTHAFLACWKWGRIIRYYQIPGAIIPRTVTSTVPRNIYRTVVLNTPG